LDNTAHAATGVAGEVGELHIGKRVCPAARQWEQVVDGCIHRVAGPLLVGHTLAAQVARPPITFGDLPNREPFTVPASGTLQCFSAPLVCALSASPRTELADHAGPTNKRQGTSCARTERQ
jgi:hypothetical protein